MRARRREESSIVPRQCARASFLFSARERKFGGEYTTTRAGSFHHVSLSRLARDSVFRPFGTCETRGRLARTISSRASPRSSARRACVRLRAAAATTSPNLAIHFGRRPGKTDAPRTERRLARPGERPTFARTLSKEAQAVFRYENDPQPGVVRELYPWTAMCVRNVDVHVSCSSQVDAQLAAFFIDPRAK